MSRQKMADKVEIGRGNGFSQLDKNVRVPVSDPLF